MTIAVDDVLLTFALRYAFLSNDDDQVSYICNRLISAVPQMQKPITKYLKQYIDDYLAVNSPDYLKEAPIKRLLEMLVIHLKEFRE